jgi:hypothetical protein
MIMSERTKGFKEDLPSELRIMFPTAVGTFGCLYILDVCISCNVHGFHDLRYVYQKIQNSRNWYKEANRDRACRSNLLIGPRIVKGQSKWQEQVMKVARCWRIGQKIVPQVGMLLPTP